MNSIFRSCGPDYRLKVVFKSPNRLRNNFSFKDALPDEMNSKVLYKYKCNTCNSVYIGETVRHYSVRACEHLAVSFSTDKALTYNEKGATAIAKHCHEHVHASSMDDFKIIGNATNRFHLKLKESLLISKLKPSLNVAKESVPLCLFDN